MLPHALFGPNREDAPHFIPEVLDNLKAICKSAEREIIGRSDNRVKTKIRDMIKSQSEK